MDRWPNVAFSQSFWCLYVEAISHIYKPCLKVSVSHWKYTTVRVWTKAEFSTHECQILDEPKCTEISSLKKSLICPIWANLTRLASITRVQHECSTYWAIDNCSVWPRVRHWSIEVSSASVSTLRYTVINTTLIPILEPGWDKNKARLEL